MNEPRFQADIQVFTDYDPGAKANVSVFDVESGERVAFTKVWRPSYGWATTVARKKAKRMCRLEERRANKADPYIRKLDVRA